jgi:hypothetical protein
LPYRRVVYFVSPFARVGWLGGGGETAMSSGDGDGDGDGDWAMALPAVANSAPVTRTAPAHVRKSRRVGRT